MVFCPKCKQDVPDDSIFCKHCGAKVGETLTEEFSVAGNDLIGKIEELIHRGNVTRIIVKDESGRLLLDFPVTAGVVGVILAPWIAALGVIAALATRCTIVVEKRA